MCVFRNAIEQMCVYIVANPKRKDPCLPVPSLFRIGDDLILARNTDGRTSVGEKNNHERPAASFDRSADFAGRVILLQIAWPQLQRFTQSIIDRRGSDGFEILDKFFGLSAVLAVGL